MTVLTPTSHLVESLKTLKDEEVELFEIRLRGPPVVFVYLTAGPSVAWQGKTYQESRIVVSDDERRVDGGLPRGKLSVGFPSAEISSYIHQGYFDFATLTRYSVLGSHVTNNINLFTKRVWVIGRAMAVSPALGAEFELRSPQDNPIHMSPSEFFIPPKFPWVVF